MDTINMRSTRRPLARAMRPTLALSALAGCMLVAWGVFQTTTMAVPRMHGDRLNPWRGLPGCTYLRDHSTDRVFYAPLSPGAQAACEDETVKPLAHDWLGQESEVLRGLRGYTQEPASMLLTARDGSRAPSILNVDGREIAQGADLMLTLDAARQPVAQLLADCMTGNDPTTNCRGLAGAGRAPTWPRMYEGAGARTLGLVEIDIATGGMMAIASAHSPCFESHWSAAVGAVPADCPPLTRPSEPANWRLDNHANKMEQQLFLEPVRL